MTRVNVAVSATINAPVSEAYPVLADYRNHHPHILPKAYFTYLEVEEGGNGQGTIFQAALKVLGQTQRFRMHVTEPEPGRVIAETDLEIVLVTKFIVEPRGRDQSAVTIATTFQPSPGVKGWLERLATPSLLQRIYHQELQNLADYVGRN